MAVDGSDRNGKKILKVLKESLQDLLMNRMWDVKERVKVRIMSRFRAFATGKME